MTIDRLPLGAGISNRSWAVVHWNNYCNYILPVSPILFRSQKPSEAPFNSAYAVPKFALYFTYVFFAWKIGSFSLPYSHTVWEVFLKKKITLTMFFKLAIFSQVASVQLPMFVFMIYVHMPLKLPWLCTFPIGKWSMGGCHLGDMQIDETRKTWLSHTDTPWPPHIYICTYIQTYIHEHPSPPDFSSLKSFFKN